MYGTLPLSWPAVDAEVDELRDAVVGDQDVLRRHVAVHELERDVVLVFELVRGVEALAGLHDDADRDSLRDLRLVLAGRLVEDAERLAVDPLHDEVEDLVLLAEVEDLGHVGVVDASRERGLVEEHLLELRVLGERRQHRLDGDGLLEPARALLAGRPNGRHPALRDWDEELVTTEHHPRNKLIVRAHRTTCALLAGRGSAHFGGGPPLRLNDDLASAEAEGL
jgi:hypothetical protein